MKFANRAFAAFACLASVDAFAPPRLVVASSSRSKATRNGARFMAMDMDAPPPPTTPDIPVIQRSAGGAPSDVRYSDFLKLVNADRIEKVTFSADGTKLLGVDTDGARLAIESLPSDPDLLTQLTSHKVDVTVLPTQESGGLGDLAQSLILPAALFAGLFFLSRRAGGAGGGMGGPGNPMGFGKAKAEYVFCA